MGKLIVVDGTDGSGKATQVELLRKRLIREGYKVKVVDFPEYYKNFFGAFIGHCLAEQYYNWVNIHPKIASIAYAADRFESKDEINGWLEKGYIVISNRYVSANQIHQGGKIASKKNGKLFWNGSTLWSTTCLKYHDQTSSSICPSKFQQSCDSSVNVMHKTNVHTLVIKKMFTNVTVRFYRILARARCGSHIHCPTSKK
ncbi:MAG: hypothetical protein KBB88_02995 [Candidatus Pacebacteria bacterium]|nr:hypothetical protein [Candidatus Paceibacterota bacterium]